MRKLLLYLCPTILSFALVLAGCAGTGTSSPPPKDLPSATSTAPTPELSRTPTPVPPSKSPVPPPLPERAPFQPNVEVVAENLEVPWALAFAPDSRLFFTERPGRIRVIVSGELVPDPVANLPVAAVSEAGLMGLALDPNFSQNSFLYVMYTYRNQQGQLRNRVSRLTEREGKATSERVLLDNLPGSNIHNGGRLKFGPDGKLYVTAGDAADPSRAHRQTTLAGKLLRLNPDGSVPEDNPFPDSPIYSLGHRNSQGLAWHPVTGTLFETEHGPVGNDEVNIIEPGQNYGWPQAQRQAKDPRFVDPILLFSPAVAPSGTSFYQGEKLWAWQGNLFFATLRGQHLHRVVLTAPEFRAVESHERLYDGEYGRLRDVVEGPDGFLYFATNNRDGRGRPGPTDDRILRIVP